MMEQEMLEKILKLTEETNATVKIVQKDVEELKERVTALEQRMDKLEKEVALHDRILFQNLETVMKTLNLKIALDI